MVTDQKDALKLVFLLMKMNVLIALTETFFHLTAGDCWKDLDQGGLNEKFNEAHYLIL